MRLIGSHMVSIRMFDIETDKNQKGMCGSYRAPPTQV